MDNCLYGFDRNINKYSMREILFYLLFFSLLIYFSGRNMEKDAVQGRYIKLIRYKNYSFWWRSVCLRALGRNVILVVVAVTVCFLCPGNGIHMPDCLYASSLWMLGLLTWNMFQLLLINSNYGVKISFPIIMIVEVLSIYGIVFGAWIVPFLPGSLLMLRRSSFLMEKGFSWIWVIVIQLLLDVCIFRFGYQIHRREMA